MSPCGSISLLGTKNSKASELNCQECKQTFCKYIIRWNNERSHSHFYFLIPGPIYSGYGEIAPHDGLSLKVELIACKIVVQVFVS